MSTCTASLLPIHDIAKKLCIHNDNVQPYGRYVAKIALNAIRSQHPTGKLILVTAITPTPRGEGKTVTTLGLSQGLCSLGKNAVACIRQPSLGPVFGIKGGAAGGGKAQVEPMEKLNFHLTGDIHAITSAHNLAAAALDARLFHETRLGDDFSTQTGMSRLNINKERIFWKRVIDHNDRALRYINIATRGGSSGVPREDGFEISAASELMAILALSRDLNDMRQRIGRIILAHNFSDEPITAEDLNVAGAMTALLKEAIEPNLMQTCEQTPVFIHAGPFANIAHGNSSVIADELGLSLADYVVTEAGFGSDMGMEKFFNIKYRQAKRPPSCVVLVATTRSIKSHSSTFTCTSNHVVPPTSNEPDLTALDEGCANLGWHIQHAKSYGVPVVVAINRFPTDTDAELEQIRAYSLQQGATACEISDAFARGGKGAKALAEAVIKAAEISSKITLPYTNDLPLREKIAILAKTYGANKVQFSTEAETDMARILRLKQDHLPLCMVKTPMSISSNPKLKNVPPAFELPVRRLDVAAGAGFIRVHTGDILTMPGLNASPAYQHIDIDDHGNIIGLS